MHLLVITQKVDRTDPILGFFHGWLETFAGECDAVIVMGQKIGAHALPSNVHVLSMGKEESIARWRQVVRFWHHAWRTRRAYDVVFVHMTPVWVVLGWPLWVLLRKRVYLWYEARGGGWALPIALRLVRRSFGATPYGLPLTSPKHVVVGHGIDTDAFVQAPDRREPGFIVAIGRITPIKNYDVIVRAFATLPKTYTLLIAGGTITERDRAERTRLDALVAELGVAERVTMAWKEPAAIPDLLQRADLLLHAGGGGLDKVVLEAMACGCPVVSCSEAARYVLPALCLALEGRLAEYAHSILALPSAERVRLSADLRQCIANDHSLAQLAHRLVREMR